MKPAFAQMNCPVLLFASSPKSLHPGQIQCGCGEFTQCANIWVYLALQLDALKGACLPLRNALNAAKLTPKKLSN